MEKTNIVSAPASIRRMTRKNLLIRGIAFLTTEKFCIFVGVIAALVVYIGALVDSDRAIGYGGLIFCVGILPGAIREAFRDLRRADMGENAENW